MNKSLKKKNCKDHRVLRSGIRRNLKVLLCLLLAVFMLGSHVIMTAAELSAAQIIQEEDDMSLTDELTDFEMLSDESDDFHNQAPLEEDREFAEFEEFAEDGQFEEVIEELTEEDEETVTSEVMEQSDEDLAFVAGQNEFFADEEGLITDPEAAPAETDLSGTDGEDFIDQDMITITIDDPIVTNPDQTSGIPEKWKRLLRRSKTKSSNCSRTN